MLPAVTSPSFVTVMVNCTLSPPSNGPWLGFSVFTREKSTTHIPSTLTICKQVEEFPHASVAINVRSIIYSSSHSPGMMLSE